jgi:hypothetical protein
MDPSFEPLTESEQQWIRDQVDRAREFAHEFDSQAPDGQPSLESLDVAFAAYLASDCEPSRANDVVLAVGAAFGARLVEDLGFRWVIATDDYGTDLAVLARPGRGNVTIYPSDFVAKRYERREAPFLAASIAKIRDHLREIAAEWGDSP